MQRRKPNEKKAETSYYKFVSILIKGGQLAVHGECGVVLGFERTNAGCEARLGGGLGGGHDRDHGSRDSKEENQEI